MNSSFPKHDKHQPNKNRVCNANAKFVDCVLEKSSSYRLRFGKYLFLSIAFWKRALPIDYVLEKSSSYQLRFGKELFLLVVFWKRALPIGCVLEKSSSYIHYIFSSTAWSLQREPGWGATVEAEVEEAGAVDD